MSKLLQMSKTYGLFVLNDKEKQQIFTKKKKRKENCENKKIKVKICSSESPNNLGSPLLLLFFLNGRRFYHPLQQQPNLYFKSRLIKCC